MERRVFIALFLSFLVYFGYQTIFPPKPAPKPAASTAGAVVPGSPTDAAASGPGVEAAVPAPVSLAGEQDERLITLETPHVSAAFTNRGGVLKSWKLREYLDRNGRPLELVDSDLPKGQPAPFSLLLPDNSTTNAVNGGLYTVTQADNHVAFEYRTEGGLVAQKEFTFNPQSYTVQVKVQVTLNGSALNPVIQWGPGLGDTDSQTGRYAVKPEALFALQGTSPERLNASKVASQAQHEATFDYAGIDDHYFAAFAFKPGRAKVLYEPLLIPPVAGSKDPARELMAFSVQPVAPGQTLTFFAGPKELETLRAIDPVLAKAINFGMFSVIVVPLLNSLNWIHGYVGNYGWAIFILTLLINIVLFPLNHKSVVSMRKMQEIQPEAKAIQERYSKLKTTDPAKQKMNQELMALYRENGVNPASGCIPILLTLPVFLAFYALLTTAIELRGAPFVGWIHDLSLPDPYYVMPILVGASQILQQWLTPQAGVDPAQQRMMMIMPVVLIFVFVTTPSGALIYWLVGNVWRIGQMQLTNYIHPPKVHVIRPPAERRVKRAGGGKTDAAARED